jgi:tetratricopeptide (TPR) repeat protein
MERRDMILSCLGGVLPFTSDLIGGEKDAWKTRQRGPGEDFFELLNGARAATQLAYRFHDLTQAQAMCEQCLAALPVAVSPSVVAEILEGRDRLRELIDDARQNLPRHYAAVKASPEDPKPRYWLAFTLQRAGRWDDAIAELRAYILSSGLDYACVRDSFGWYHFRSGEFQEALRWFSLGTIEHDELPIPDFSQFCLSLEGKMLAEAELGMRDGAEKTAWEYVRRYDRVPWAVNYTLKRKVNLDADGLYVKYKCETI